MNKIDLSIGEPYLIRENLIKAFSLSSELYSFAFNKANMSYQQDQGYAPLVKYLEDKHQAPVIITNGAKQGLAASFYLLNRLNKKKVYLPSPYWSAIPNLANIYDVSCTQDKIFDSILCVAPNNPDGKISSSDDLVAAYNFSKDRNIPFIHDAAYYSHIYLPYSYELKSFGDVQLFSFSKQLGFSGFRIGYMVIHNPFYYDFLKNYVSQTTVGVSSQTQSFLFDFLKNRVDSYQTLYKFFEGKSFYDLKDNKKLCKQLPNTLEIPENIEDANGMFLWAKCKDKSIFTKNNIIVEDGKDFGNKDFIRMNLAVSNSLMKEVVERLNGSKQI